MLNMLPHKHTLWYRTGRPSAGMPYSCQHVSVHGSMLAFLVLPRFDYYFRLYWHLSSETNSLYKINQTAIIIIESHKIEIK